MSLSYNVIDGNGGSVAASQSFSLAAVNDAPTGSPTAVLAAGTEDTAYTVSAANLLAGFSDVDIATNGQVLSISGAVTSNHGTVVDNGNGTFTITPAANYNGAVTLSYNVIDGNGSSVAATQSFNLTAVNDAPTGSATAALAAGTEDTAYTVSAASLLAGFSDVDGDTLSVSALSTSNGSVVDNGNGTFTITPTANYNGPVNLTYNVIDGNGGTIAASQSYTPGCGQRCAHRIGHRHAGRRHRRHRLYRQRRRPARRLQRCRWRHPERVGPVFQQRQRRR